jgi:hypothetical protein
MSALRLSEIGERRACAISTAVRQDEASPYIVSILWKGLVVQTLVEDLSEAHEIIDQAEAADRCRFAAIVDRNGRHVPRRSGDGGPAEEPDPLWDWCANHAADNIDVGDDVEHAEGLNEEEAQR